MNTIQTRSFNLAVYSKGDSNAKKLALVLPGRLDTKDYVHMGSHVNYLAGKSFFALSFDPPGTWESGNDLSQFTTTNYIKVVNELIEYFGNKPTLLIGHSRGGAVAIQAAANPFVKGIIAVMATYGAPSAPSPEAIELGFQMEYRDLPPGDVKTAKQREFELPLNYFKDGEQYNPVETLRKLQKPKLLFYGTQDEFISPAKVKEVYETIPEPKMIHELDSEHDYRYRPEIIEEVNRVVGDFLSKID